MRFKLFESRHDVHIRRSREYLEEACIARVEHQAAAEHHMALARMYAERIARLEAEIYAANQPRATPVPSGRTATATRPGDTTPAEADGNTVVYPVYPSRSTRP